MAQQQMPSSQKALMLELKSLQEEPVEGFRITLVEESDLYNWEVAIFGPPNTLYEGGYFKAHIKFPVDYPYSPPTFRFLTKMWHPNIYERLLKHETRNVMMEREALLIKLAIQQLRSEAQNVKGP
ncbi:ubiquitin-conjugating enzyme E2 R2-like isoform X1 [Polypterus senegalus]|uniref:ubiquitin-conjugating enzyme E2 R2-like isoform X1 n=1 Tax=Polypterus senegalus TaxID=55291 RepID=UPI001964AB00|nr:ubiquitin-conjugating enzyme E2 R2-like isoform X1 [Polypterus senegalus]